MSRPNYFKLPNCPECFVLDRFSLAPEIEEDERGEIPYWPLFCSIIQQPHVSTPDQLVSILETLSATVNDGTTQDYGTLEEFLSGVNLSDLWPKLQSIALDLPVYFPDGRLDVLSPNRGLSLTRSQVACLVVHQFLCSAIPQRNDDGYQNFGIWYPSRQRHTGAVKMYLTALFEYFESLPAAGSLKQYHENGLSKDHEKVEFKLHRGANQAPLGSAQLTSIDIDYLENHTTASHLPEVQGIRGAVVVPSNKIIGFGQSATQEEIFLGIAPESCPAVLFTPHLTDEDVLTISGARAMLTVTGQRRDISWEVRDLPSPESVQTWLANWTGGNLILMDALEMDMAEATNDLPDLKPENIDREIRKAFIGFSSKQFTKVWTGLWGCGAFCGDAAVKLIILWIAASKAGVTLHLMLGHDQHDIGHAFEEVVSRCEHKEAQRLREILGEVPKGPRKVEILEWIKKKLS